ncbi:MAG: FdrA family protein [Clostridia bacterium]|nr:FdrA family protein [Clostridia bacterium]
MSIYVRIEKNRYIDSLDTLSMTAVLNEMDGITTGLIGMANKVFKGMASEMGFNTEEIIEAGESDFVVVADAVSQEHFAKAVSSVLEKNSAERGGDASQKYTTIDAAVAENGDANLCSISVPGEYALMEVEKALNAGLHCVVFSNNVPLEDERKMKDLAREKGLLCMGPDCGVANINGAALVLSSINNRGPYGIVGASGTGIQHVAAILHEAGSGVSQTIGTGGNDLKEKVGGITMLMGIDALEADPETKYIILISRKPSDAVLEKLLARIADCRKPKVVFFMGCNKEEIEKTGAIWTESLDECAEKALGIEHISFHFESDHELKKIADEAVLGLGANQKYIRGAYSGGTYMDEAMRVMWNATGGIWSNAPLTENFKLPDSFKSVANTCIDYGEEEFTLGRPHPAIDPGVRRPAILREAQDEETAVILLDFILTPPGHMDPVGFVIDDIRKAQLQAAKRGGKIIFIASVLGTTADWQDIANQKRKLREAGVLVVSTNYRAAKLASLIALQIKERA